MKRILIILGVVLGLALLVGVNVRRANDRGTEVQVTEISRRDLTEKISGSGRVEARRSVDITSVVVGKVLEVAVEEGDTVEAGQLILRVDPGERRAGLEQAQARLARAQAREELARAERKQAELRLERVRGLMGNNLASDQDLEDAQTGAEVAEANLAAARGDVRDARAALDFSQYELDRTVIRAEIPGVVVRLAVEEGENVLAGDLYNSGSSIVTIADLSEMEVHVLVDETEVVKLRRGQAATVNVDAYPDLDLPGEVVEVGNSAYNSGSLGSQEAKDFRVRVRLNEIPENFRPGLSARAEIVTQARTGALAVPIEALVLRDPEREQQGRRSRSRSKDRDDEDNDDDDSGAGRQEVEGVYVVADGKAQFKPVEIGIAGEKHFEVVSGLEEGESVVRSPFDALRRMKTGDRLKVEKKSRRGARSGGDEDEEDPAEDE